MSSARIRIERRKKGRRPTNAYVDDRGRQDWQEDWAWLEEPSYGQVLRKRVRQHKMRDETDPAFDVPYNESVHGQYMRENLNLDHLSPARQAQVRQIIIDHWGVFNPAGANIPVQDYECHIDTGTASPVRCRRVQYGPRESKIMMPMIDKLESLGQIHQIFEGEWLSNGLLAPKPHQENVFDIGNYVWRFCVNYIGLNRVTKIISYPIPRCDFAVAIRLGKAKFRWLLDAPQGFHQIRVSKESMEKLAFAAPYTRKYTYRVMPFGPVNGPATFVIFVHDCQADWNDMAISQGVDVGNDTGSTIIIDDIHGRGFNWEHSLVYFKCQLAVCMRRRLSLNLKKCHLFTPRFEFVGHDIADDGNHPAESKFDLVKNWPDPITVRDVAGLIGFGQFYSGYIPFFKLRIKSLRQLCRLDYDHTITPEDWTATCKAQWEFIKKSILSDPCLAQYDPNKRIYLKTDFAVVGMGYVVCQPANDEVSMAAMEREAQGGPCEFLASSTSLSSPPQLRPIAMGSRRNKGYELRLHSHLGEAFTVDWALGQNRLYLWGGRFTSITDCHSLKYCLTYEGSNPVLLRMQMRLMLWNMDIVHRTRDYNVDSDYMSKLALDSRFDPLLSKYLQVAAELRDKYPPPSGDILPSMLPGYRQPRNAPPPSHCNTRGITIDGVPLDPLDVAHAIQLHTSVTDSIQRYNDKISIYPIHYFTPTNGPVRQFVTTRSQSRQPTPPSPPTPPQLQPLQNNELSSGTRQLTTYQAILYGFGGGHVCHSLSKLPPCIRFVAGADLSTAGRALMHSELHIPRVFSTSRQLVNWILSDDDLYVDFVIIHAPPTLDASSVLRWWKSQVQLLLHSRLRRGTQLFVIFIPSAFASTKPPREFFDKLTSDGWVLSHQDLHFSAFGDSIDDVSHTIFGVHRSASASVAPLQVLTPPLLRPEPISSFIYQQFNESSFAISFAKSMIDQYDPDSDLVAVDPLPSASSPVTFRSRRKYNLLPRTDLAGSTVGAGVYDVSCLMPPVTAPSDNIFDNLFGIEYDCMNTTLVRQISPYEAVRGYGFGDEIARTLALRSNLELVQGAIPTRTSSAVFDCVITYIRDLCDTAVTVDETTPFAAPAATSQILFNGATSYTLPDRDRWLTEYEADPQTKLIRYMAQNPDAITKENLDKIHYVYWRYLRESLIIIDSDDMLQLHERLSGSDDFCSLQIVPAGLQNVVFIAFHANPVGGHFNAYRTFSRIRGQRCILTSLTFAPFVLDVASPTPPFGNPPSSSTISLSLILAPLCT